MKTRLPAVAGSFYADTEGELRTQIQGCFLHSLGPKAVPAVPAARNGNVLGFIVPHAGYEYSGPVAAHSFFQLASSGPRQSIVIIGPNHSGRGSAVSTSASDEWSTPLGEVQVDSELRERIVKNSGLIDVEDNAHRTEHSIEVQLPFLQFIYPRKFRFVPICMMLQDLETSKNVGEAIATAIGEDGTIVLASSDWTHYEPQEKAMTKDKEALRRVVDLDPKSFQETIEDENVSACGYGPVTALIYGAKILGANHAELLSYQTSGDMTCDKSAVVGYAAVRFAK